MVLIRIYLLVVASLEVLDAVHRLLDERAVVAWRTSGDAIWGPEAFRFHVAGHLFAAMLAVTIARAGVRTREDLGWAIGLLAFQVLLGVSEKGSFSLPLMGLLLVALAFYEGCESGAARPRPGRSATVDRFRSLRRKG